MLCCTCAPQTAVFLATQNGGQYPDFCLLSISRLVVRYCYCTRKMSYFVRTLPLLIVTIYVLPSVHTDQYFIKVLPGFAETRSRRGKLPTVLVYQQCTDYQVDYGNVSSPLSSTLPPPCPYPYTSSLLSPSTLFPPHSYSRENMGTIWWHQSQAMISLFSLTMKASQRTKVSGLFSHPQCLHQSTQHESITYVQLAPSETIR